MHTINFILVPNFSFLGWFSFSSTVISCRQLLTADGNWYEIKFPCNFHVHTKVDICAIYQLSIIIIIFYQLLSAVISCWQLLTADDNWYENSFTGIFMYTLLVISLPNFSSVGWFLFSSAFDSCYQLLTADDSWYEKRIWLEFLCTD